LRVSVNVEYPKTHIHEALIAWIHNEPLEKGEVVFFEMFIWELASLQMVFWALGLPSCAGCLDFHKETGGIC